MSLLTMTQALATEFGIPVPGSAASSTDQNIIQVVGFVNQAGRELAARHEWQNICDECTFTSLAAESQGLITAIILANASSTVLRTSFNHVVNDTIWNRTQRRPIFGPRSNAEWQQLKAQFVQGPWYQWRLRANAMIINPVIAAGQTLAWEYQSNNWASTADGLTGKTAMTLDTDVALLDERLIELDALWRFKKAKGLDYDADFDIAETAIQTAMGQDGSRPVLSLNGACLSIYPGVIVPAGNWGV